MSTQGPKVSAHGAKISAQAAKVSVQAPKAGAHAATVSGHAPTGAAPAAKVASPAAKIGGQAPGSPPAKSKLTPEQRAWFKKLGAVVNSGGDGAVATETAAPPARGTQPAGPGTQRVAALGGKPGTKEALGPGALIPVIPVVIDALKIKCTCKVLNRSQQKLLLNKIKLDHPTGNGFEKAPADEIAPGGSDEFVVVNKAPFHLGVLGEMEYEVEGENPETIVFIRWEHARSDDIPIIGTDTEAKMEVRPTNAKKFEANKNVNSDLFTFLFKSKGGAPPPPPPPGPQPPGPQPAQDVKASCLITVTNNTKLPLTLADQGHDRGDFFSFPPQTIPPGGSNQFVSSQTPRGKDTGCKGFVSWEVGSPSAGIWRCEWDNVVGDKNTAKAPAEPQSAGFRTLAQIGEGDENVPVAFTISGGGDGPGPKPGPGPQPPGPEPEPPPEPFVPPPGSRQPTLRLGDKSPDGWVEFLQVQLNHHLGLDLDTNGVFDKKVLNAVLDFQKKRKLKVDGIVGNQTWAALRDDTPEPPSTDGRAPHTFEEKGPQARFDNEQVDGVYTVSQDLLEIFVASVGEVPIDKFHLHVRVTPPDSKSFVKQFVIGPPFANKGKTQPGGGAQHKVRIEKFKKIFPAKDPNAKVSDYKFEAFFDQELGPDVFRGKINEIP